MGSVYSHCNRQDPVPIRVEELLAILEIWQVFIPRVFVSEFFAVELPLQLSGHQRTWLLQGCIQDELFWV